MKVTRLDLDGAGSPAALVTRILEIEPDLPMPVPIEALCEQLDIVSIGDLETEEFEAALVTDAVKSSGAILFAKGRSHQRRRFSIGHELGHFLIPTHTMPVGAPLLCSDEQLRLLDTKDQDRRRRMEAEANRFSALLLMSPPILRAELQKIRSPDVTDIVRLADLFEVSKDAMARAYADNSRQAVAIIVIRNGRVLRIYRNDRQFPWIDVAPSMPVPQRSAYLDGIRNPGDVSPTEDCEPEVWLISTSARKVEVMIEQVLEQKSGFALLMLHAEMSDDDDR